MPCCFLGLGGNVGNVAATFASALDDLARADDRLRVVRTSSVYQTAAVGDNAGGEFLNAAVEIETELNPFELLQRVQWVESASGRTHAIHWGPRPLDIDLLLYEAEIVLEPGLLIPHPALWYRRFVLDPLAEIAADVIHPVWHASIDQLRQRMLMRPLQLRLAGKDIALRDRLLAQLRVRFPFVEIETDATDFAVHEAETAIVAWLNPAEESESVGGADSRVGRICVPTADDGGLSFLSSVIAAATDQPVRVAGPIVA